MKSAFYGNKWRRCENKVGVTTHQILSGLGAKPQDVLANVASAFNHVIPCIISWITSMHLHCFMQNVTNRLLSLRWGNQIETAAWAPWRLYSQEAQEAFCPSLEMETSSQTLGKRIWNSSISSFSAVYKYQWGAAGLSYNTGLTDGNGWAWFK